MFLEKHNGSYKITQQKIEVLFLSNFVLIIQYFSVQLFDGYVLMT